MSMIDKPGLYDIPEAAYHTDPCPEPSLSASIANIMLARSPWHAWTAHPRLNPNLERKDASKFDRGKVAHALMLEGPERLAVIDAADYKTMAAKAARDAALEAGKIPILAGKLPEVEAMVAAGRAQLARHRDACTAFTDGRPEQTIAWQEDGTWCRLKLDWRPYKGSVFDDYKTTGASAEPDAWTRTMYGIGADVQAAFYRRGIRAVLGIPDPIFRFIVQEVEPPYALSVIALTPAALDLADADVERALALWRRCLAEGKWPGYPARTCYVDAPGYEVMRREGRVMRDEGVRQAGGDPFAVMMDWQRPLENAR